MILHNQLQHPPSSPSPAPVTGGRVIVASLFLPATVSVTPLLNSPVDASPAAVPFPPREPEPPNQQAVISSLNAKFLAGNPLSSLSELLASSQKLSSSSSSVTSAASSVNTSVTSINQIIKPKPSKDGLTLLQTATTAAANAAAAAAAAATTTTKGSILKTPTTPTDPASLRKSPSVPSAENIPRMTSFTRYRKLSESRDRAGDPLFWRVEPSGLGNIGLQNAVESFMGSVSGSNDSTLESVSSSRSSSISENLASSAGGNTSAGSAVIGLGFTHEDMPKPSVSVVGDSPNANPNDNNNKFTRIWVGCPGRITTETWSKSTKERIGKALWGGGRCCVPVYLTDDELDGHYNQFCKQVLWKPFHYQLPDYPKGQAYEEMAWRQYVAVNRHFAQTILQHYKPGDIIWVNDYHLMLVPAMVRQLIADAAIGFFLHIPFPSSEIFRCLHVRKQILEGMLGADLIGFQTYSFMRHFLMTCTRILSLESTPKGIQMDNTVVSVGIFPIGINYESLMEKRRNPEVQEMITALQEKYMGKRILIGRDKNDYVKGIRQKMLAYERFLNQHPDFVGKVVLIQVALSTTEANENQAHVSDVVARINSKFGSIEYLPVVFLHQDISFNHYLALMSIADACLITSLRDGMNLTSHEYVVCQETKHSPLIISEFAGTYGSFGAALRVNPWDTQEVASAIYEALTMSDDEKQMRWGELHAYVSTHTAQNYVETFVKEIPRVHEAVQHMEVSHIPALPKNMVSMEYATSNRRVFFLDHDGTICQPSLGMDPYLLEQSTKATVDLVTKLAAADSRNLVYVMSGRKKEDLSPFVGIPNVGVCAENGCFLVYANRSKWETMLGDQDLSWRKQIIDIFEYYTDRTPGSYIERKEISIVWHYQYADLSFGSWQAAECQNHIQNALGTTFPIVTLMKKRSIEVLPRNVTKGVICKKVLEYHQGRTLHRRVSTNMQQDLISSLAFSSNTPRAASSPLSSPVQNIISVPQGPEIPVPAPADEVSPTTTPTIASSNRFPTSHHHQHHNLSHTHHGSFKEYIDFIFCVGDDRSDEHMFEYLHRLDGHHSSTLRESNSGTSPVFSFEDTRYASGHTGAPSPSPQFEGDISNVLTSPTTSAISQNLQGSTPISSTPATSSRIPFSPDLAVGSGTQQQQQQSSSQMIHVLTPPPPHHHHHREHHHHHHQNHHRQYSTPLQQVHSHDGHGRYSTSSAPQRRCVVTVTVGSKSSHARWYLPDVNEVVELLERLIIGTSPNSLQQQQ